MSDDAWEVSEIIDWRGSSEETKNKIIQRLQLELLNEYRIQNDLLKKKIKRLELALKRFKS